jgi:hypothetical protein
MDSKQKIFINFDPDPVEAAGNGVFSGEGIEWWAESDKLTRVLMSPLHEIVLNPWKAIIQVLAKMVDHGGV